MAVHFIYTHHANLRIRQRDLSRSQIQNTIIAPDRKISGFRGRVVVQKHFGPKALEVVFKKLNSTIVIITAYWLTEG